MTIDEAIAHERQKAKDNRNEFYTFGVQKCKQYAEEHEQLEEWLEELKAFQENKWTDIYIKRGYNKAIDDFSNRLYSKIKSEIDDRADELEWIDEIAKQLKAGDVD